MRLTKALTAVALIIAACTGSGEQADEATTGSPQTGTTLVDIGDLLGTDTTSADTTPTTTTTGDVDQELQCPRHEDQDTVCLADLSSSGLVVVTARENKTTLTEDQTWLASDPAEGPVMEVEPTGFSLVKFVEERAGCTLGDREGQYLTTAWLRVPDEALMTQFGGMAYCTLPGGSRGVDVLGIARLEPDEQRSRIGSERQEGEYRAFVVDGRLTVRLVNGQVEELEDRQALVCEFEEGSEETMDCFPDEAPEDLEELFEGHD